QGRGYAYEVCEAILRYAKEELDFERVICFVKQENAASLGLCAKLGFIEKGMEQLGTDAYIMLRKHL
ncbi:MAG: GNAT family N-acetyltransferase, partial [Lachnospiraceae bacterium]|nr:GNAT family N-acetyltransferase [Lachnospiraceae bacterium]